MTSYIQWCPEWLAMHRMARQELSPHPRAPRKRFNVVLCCDEPTIKTRILRERDNNNFCWQQLQIGA